MQNNASTCIETLLELHNRLVLGLNCAISGKFLCKYIVVIKIYRKSFRTQFITQLTIKLLFFTVY